MKAQNTSFHDGGGGEERGRLFWRKVFPVPLSKDFWTRGKVYADPEFYHCGSAVQGFVRSAIGDPDLRSPFGFDSGLRPPLRMTRRGGCGVPGGCTLDVWRSRPAVALRVRLRASPSAQDDT